MATFDPAELSGKDLHGMLLSSIAPRPICLASTIDAEGNNNLSPFSYFNIFGTNPPLCIFSPARRVRDNTTKDTLHNADETREVVINLVNFDIVQQMSLSSTEYPTGVDEFVKSGLTAIASDLIKPMRVKEAPVQLECTVRDVVQTGDGGGAGNLIICEIIKIHVNDAVLLEDGTIDQHKIDLVGRLGKNWYVRASGDALFEVEKPLTTLGIGVDQIPERIRKSYILTGNDLGMLGNVEKLPTKDEILSVCDHPRMKDIFRSSSDGLEARELLHEYAHELLLKGKVSKAWKVLLADQFANQSK
ncbi:MAG: flavin reductase family protein [Schleiferiaceae bacterium]|nr:flavin reductase family protein [Schleiferiaceae bacterium]